MSPLAAAYYAGHTLAIPYLAISKSSGVETPRQATYGVGHLWLIDPDLGTLEAFELREQTWTLIARLKDDDSVRVPPFDATDFALSALWG